MKGYMGIGMSVCAAALGLACLSPAEPRAAAAEAGRATVRIGLVETLFPDTPEPLMQVMIRPFKSLLETQTGVRGHVIVGGDAESISRQLKEDRIQLGVFHGIEFGWARLKNPDLRPLIIAINRNRVLRACLVVSAGSPARDHTDLQGKKVGLPRLSREHCRLFLERRCCKEGCTPAKFYGEVSNPPDAEDALDTVVDGKLDAAVIDGTALENFRQLKPGRAAKLKILQQSEPFPSAVVAYQAGGLAETLLERFRQGMINARGTRHGRQLLEMCRITAFEAVPTDYEQLLASIVKAYPPPTR
jgi:ABC-type phosphate/phosphonate transport system substrate-binding protein